MPPTAKNLVPLPWPSQSQTSQEATIQRAAKPEESKKDGLLENALGWLGDNVWSPAVGAVSGVVDYGISQATGIADIPLQIIDGAGSVFGQDWNLTSSFNELALSGGTAAAGLLSELATDKKAFYDARNTTDYIGEKVSEFQSVASDIGSVIFRNTSLGAAGISAGAAGVAGTAAAATAAATPGGPIVIIPGTVAAGALTVSGTMAGVSAISAVASSALALNAAAGKNSANMMNSFGNSGGNNFNHREKYLKQVSNKKLQNAVSELYRPTAHVGDGGTAAILEKEILDGGPLTHKIKAEGMVTHLQDILKTEQLTDGEQKLARQLLNDLYNALKKVPK